MVIYYVIVELEAYSDAIFSITKDIDSAINRANHYYSQMGHHAIVKEAEWNESELIFEDYWKDYKTVYTTKEDKS